MAPLVALTTFDRVAEGVAVVEDFAQIRLAQIRGHDLGLDLYGAPNQLGQNSSRRIESCLGIGFDEIQDHRVGDESGLDDLGHACNDLVVRHSLERREIDEHRSRFVERTDEVLARFGVDTGLAAHCCVDHREQGGGDVNYLDTAHPRSRDEAGEVGRRSPAQNS